MVPDLVFPSDNEWGVPALSLEPERFAPVLQAPLLAWGSVARGACRGGTWAFYVDDYRFDALWSDPDSALISAPAALAEVNYSVYDDTPRAVALWAIYRKRWLSCYWQRAGAAIWVDVCSSHQHADLTLLGVPEGWQRFATAGFDARIEDLDAELELAVRRSAGAPFTLLVYGGGAETRAWCAGRANVLHAPRAADQRKRNGEGTRRRLRREAESA
jgi:hypothetical protein